ncbi:hypothetical protein D3C86_2024170 [compost metagenome]
MLEVGIPFYLINNFPTVHAIVQHNVNNNSIWLLGCHFTQRLLTCRERDYAKALLGELLS